MSTSETLASRLEMALDERGLSARQAAARLGVSQAAVSRWLAGERQPDAAGLQALMGLGISANWLLTGQGSPEADRAESAQYRAGRRDGLAAARNAVQLLEGAHEAAGNPTPASVGAKTIAQVRAAKAAEPSTGSGPPRRRQKGG